MYDYRLVLPAPFQVVAGANYWLQIEASQSNNPNWGIAVASGGDGGYLRYSSGAKRYQFMPFGDTAFTLLK